MRMTVGYAFVFILLPAFFLLLYFSGTEWQNAAAYNEAVEEAVDLDKAFPEQTTFLVDQNGKRFSQLSPQLRLYLEPEEIPVFLKDITVLSEDQNFYDHIGFDAGAIIRAVVKNLVFTHIQQGGSTITQQLARNLYLTQEKTYNRKLTELLYAHEIEKTLSKDEILSGYLNIIYYSNGVYGIRGASMYYFQKDVDELSKAELAFLAAIPNNPDKYDPVDHFDTTKERQERLLDLMVAEGKITKEESDELKQQKITLSLFKSINQFPDYAVYVEHELVQLIGESEGYNERIEAATSPEQRQKIQEELRSRAIDVLNSGVTIHTALDPEQQKQSTAALKQHLPYEGVEGASILIRNDTREIVSIVGGKSYERYNFNRAYQAIRQPGSAIKPLLVFGPYIEQNQPALSATVDASDYCKNDYCPENYGGAQYNEVTLSTAFALSLNTPAIRLLEQTGVQQAFNTINAFDFQHTVPDDYTLAAAAGGFSYGMTPLELTNAYTSFIDGSYRTPHAIRSVRNANGDILYEWKTEPVIVWSTETTDKMRSLLANAAQNGTGAPAYVQKPYVGIKTGTTNQYFDYWTMGLTNEYTGGVWVGHDTPVNMEAIETDRPAHYIWRDMMK